MANFKYTSVDRVLSKIQRDYGLEGVDDGDIIEWIGEALEGIGASRQYEEAVSFIEVSNHQCVLPQNFHKVIQIAGNNCYVKDRKDNTALCPKTIVDIVNPLDTPAPSCPIVLDCQGQPIQEYELAYYRPYFDLQYEYYGWMGNSIYKACFTPIRKATSSFASLVCEEKDEHIRQLYQSSREEYSIIGGDTLRFSFCDGQIALAYLRNELDADGYPMIPDDYSYMQAVSVYIMMKVSARDFYKGREGAERRMKQAEADWQWYCKQAGNKAMMPQGLDEWQNLGDQMKYLIPQTNGYNTFFGRIGTPEVRKFDNPDWRNKSSY